MVLGGNGKGEGHYTRERGVAGTADLFISVDQW